jgi:hypothetical protein
MDGATDAGMEGWIDAGMDGATEAAMDGATDAGMEGAEEGAREGAGEGEGIGEGDGDGKQASCVAAQEPSIHDTRPCPHGSDGHGAAAEPQGHAPSWKVDKHTRDTFPGLENMPTYRYPREGINKGAAGLKPWVIFMDPTRVKVFKSTFTTRALSYKIQ